MTVTEQSEEEQKSEVVGAFVAPCVLKKHAVGREIYCTPGMGKLVFGCTHAAKRRGESPVGVVKAL